MNYRLLNSIYRTMVELGYNEPWSLTWSQLWLQYFADPTQTLVVDTLKAN